MNKRKTTGVILMAIGVGLMLLSRYIDEQVGEGREQIARGQSQLNTIDTVFSSNQYTRGVGKTITSSGQKKINAGIMEANYYADVANWCWLGGIGCLAVGAVMFLVPARRS